MSKRAERPLDKAAYLTIKGLGRFMQYAPRNLALAAGSLIGQLSWLFLVIQRKRLAIAIDNLRHLYPGAGEQGLRGIVKKVCRHFGRFLTDCSRLPLLERGSFEGRLRFEGFERFLSAYREGKGVILATAHFGHFELANAALAVMGYPVWYVLRTVDNREMDEYFDTTRKTTGLGVIKKERAAREILRNLRAGQIVAIHIDQHAFENSIYAPFFGEMVSTITTPAVMSLRTGAPVVPMLSFRDDASDSYTIRFYPRVTINPTGDVSADVRQITEKLNATLEEAVREAPEQWFWLHRRWKHAPSPQDLAVIEKQRALIDTATRQTGAAGNETGLAGGRSGAGVSRVV